MATDAQMAANRSNAAASTGPRTGAGKARSSLNATRHGLNSPPASEAVIAAYRCVTGDPEAAPDPIDMALRRPPEWVLAEAEAQVQRVRALEEGFLRRLAQGQDLIPDLRHFSETLIHRTVSIPGVSPEVERILLADQGKLPFQEIHEVREYIETVSQRLRKLLRYRRAAEVARTKALRILIEERESARGHPQSEANSGRGAEIRNEPN